eukprot:1833993-Rhodomonas_salina.2
MGDQILPTYGAETGLLGARSFKRRKCDVAAISSICCASEEGFGAVGNGEDASAEVVLGFLETSADFERGRVAVRGEQRWKERSSISAEQERPRVSEAWGESSLLTQLWSRSMECLKAAIILSIFSGERACIAVGLW